MTDNKYLDPRYNPMIRTSENQQPAPSRIKFAEIMEAITYLNRNGKSSGFQIQPTGEGNVLIDGESYETDTAQKKAKIIIKKAKDFKRLQYIDPAKNPIINPTPER